MDAAPTHFRRTGARGVLWKFAQCLNLDHLSDTALDKRFGSAIKPLLGTWIIRKRLANNRYLYEATIPARTASDRYAILRPADIDLLDVPPPKGMERVGVPTSPTSADGS